jgi:hypothetical protein
MGDYIKKAMLRASATKGAPHPRLQVSSADEAAIEEGALGALAVHGQAE